METQRQCRSFDSVKAALRSKGIKYSILFPAKLQMVDGETVRFFTAPKDAAAWLEALQALLHDTELSIDGRRLLMEPVSVSLPLAELCLDFP